MLIILRYSDYNQAIFLAFLCLIVYFKIISETWDMPIGEPRLLYLSSYLKKPYLPSQQAMGYSKSFCISSGFLLITTTNTI